MNFTRATYNPEEETVTVNGVISSYEKYWKTQAGVSDTEGEWDNDNNKFIPDGFFDETTGYIKVD
jgi:hypothetical protein